MYSDIRELLVEGELDISFYSDVLERKHVDGVTVRDSDYIHLTDDEIRDAGFSTGAKGRLLTVARALLMRSTERTLVATVVIVVDRDYDGVPVSLDALVVQTDGYSLESYALEQRSVHRFIRDFLGRHPQPPGAGDTRRAARRAVSAGEFLGRLLPACIEAAAARRFLWSLDRGVGVIDRWTDYFQVGADGHYTARTIELVQASLTAAGQSPELVTEDDLVAARAEVAASTTTLIRGHDYVSLVYKLLRSTWGRRIAPVRLGPDDEHHVHRWIVMAIDSAVVDALHMSDDIAAKFRTTSTTP
jgi:hypothetical protein